MAFSINSNGMEIYLDIKYDKNRSDDEVWCETDYSFKLGDIINYHCENDEVLENTEIRKIERFLSKFLDVELKKGDYICFIEPDFCFYFDHCIMWEIRLWGGGNVGANSFSISLYKEEAEKLRDYLREIIGVKNDNNS